MHIDSVITEGQGEDGGKKKAERKGRRTHCWESKGLHVMPNVPCSFSMLSRCFSASHCWYFLATMYGVSPALFSRRRSAPAEIKISMSSLEPCLAA